jgi:hypothetical protein
MPFMEDDRSSSLRQGWSSKDAGVRGVRAGDSCSEVDAREWVWSDGGGLERSPAANLPPKDMYGSIVAVTRKGSGEVVLEAGLPRLGEGTHTGPTNVEVLALNGC